MFYDNEDFYPTPAELADKMVAMADLKRVHSEVSAFCS